MGFRSVAQFQCDACDAESDEVNVPVDLMQAEAPEQWTRIHITRRDGELAVMEIRYVCPDCLGQLVALFAERRKQ